MKTQRISGKYESISFDTSTMAALKSLTLLFPIRPTF